MNLKPAYPLNGSALALPRIVAALLENNQKPEGMKIPEVLVPFYGFDLFMNNNVINKKPGAARLFVLLSPSIFIVQPTFRF